MPKTKTVITVNNTNKHAYDLKIPIGAIVTEERTYKEGYVGTLSRRIVSYTTQEPMTRFERKTALLGLINERINKLRDSRILADYADRWIYINEQDRQTARFDLISRFF